MTVNYPVHDGRSRPKREHVLRELIFSLFVRGWLLAIIFLVVFISVLLVAILLPPVYQATAKFSMTIPKTIDPLETQTVFDYKNFFHRQLQQQKELITSNRVLLKVMQKLKFGTLRHKADVLDEMRKKLKVIPPKGETFEGTTFFYLIYEDRTARRATKFADALANAYLETFGELAQEKADYSHSFYTEQTRELYQTMQAKEKILRNYEKEQALILIEILNLESRAASNMETGPNALLTAFTAKYNELREELAGVQATIRTIDKHTQGNRIPVVLPEMEVSGRAITVFKRKVAQLQIQLNEMKPRFRQKFELLQQVKDELNLNIASLKRELNRSVTAKKIQAETIQARLAELEKTLAELKARIRVTAQEKSRYEELKNAFNIAKVAYVSATNQLEQARLAQALNKEKSNITYVDHPVTPDEAARPNRLLIIILGFFAALFLAIATGLTFDYFDHSIRRHEDIEQYLEVTILGSLPRL